MSSLLVEAVPAGVAQVVVPVQNPAPPPGQGAEFGKASPIALVLIIVLGLATVLLIRSMSKRIRRLPASFDGSSGDQARDDQGQEEKSGGEAADPGRAADPGDAAKAGDAAKVGDAAKAGDAADAGDGRA